MIAKAVFPYGIVGADGGAGCGDFGDCGGVGIEMAAAVVVVVAGDRGCGTPKSTTPLCSISHHGQLDAPE
jgi:hypothetical protein